MPELPEVETIIRNLNQQGQNAPSLIGGVFDSVDVQWARSIATPSVDQFCEVVVNNPIRQISRRAKYINIKLAHGYLIMHLRMSGDLRYETRHALDGSLLENKPHDRVVFNLADYRLAFNDTRKFGRLWWLEDAAQLFQPLGPEPLDELFTVQEFHQRLQATSRQLKPLLMDQHFLAGLGNIYTDEALHRARLHPCRVASSLSFQQAAVLLAAIRETLLEGIQRNGASIDWVYRGGDFQNHFRVYQQTGKPCQTCGAEIKRIVVGQRSTHFCPECQNLESINQAG